MSADPYGWTEPIAGIKVSYEPGSGWEVSDGQYVAYADDLYTALRRLYARRRIV